MKVNKEKYIKKKQIYIHIEKKRLDKSEKLKSLD